MMKITVKEGTNHPHRRALTLYPYCGREAVLEALGQNDIYIGDAIVAGQRKCPNPECNGHLFILFKRDKLIAAYPPITLAFDSENIPEKIKKTFEEAIQCHASGCFVASAIMVRHTLEEICEDKNAQGTNLKEKISNLKTKIVIPKELLEAMDELRLLGNDAAHVEAKAYQTISEAELEVAIELTKEIMKALYQYSSLLDKLRLLKKN